jgi:tRNA/rRNA methyltransferase
LNRATPTPAEVTMLRGILRQMEWALQSLPKSDVGEDDPSQES